MSLNPAVLHSAKSSRATLTLVTSMLHSDDETVLTQLFAASANLYIPLVKRRPRDHLQQRRQENEGVD